MHNTIVEISLMMVLLILFFGVITYAIITTNKIYEIEYNCDETDILVSKLINYDIRFFEMDSAIYIEPVDEDDYIKLDELFNTIIDRDSIIVKIYCDEHDEDI